MLIAQPDLIERARSGDLTDKDISRMYAEVGDISDMVYAARKRARAVEAHRSAVDQYARSMLPAFGLSSDAWITFTTASHPEARQ